MSEEKPYHHGDLRRALLMAAEAELGARGIEAFSLRSVAKQANVSHAAPAHHFGDAQGLLTALATEGFRQLLASQLARQAIAPAEPAEQLLASGLGYIDFAVQRPALFRLLWGSDRPDFADSQLAGAAQALYQHLVNLVWAAGGRTVADESTMWAVAHGLADLLSAGRMKAVGSFQLPMRDQVLSDILRRGLPA
ncbi:MAG: TetR/AcrR family transcriptional regulator [Phyllobacteriaceae bacterium]|nr:TetR/AcrR family transcriptional regulator [Phyllobacteriaceae bacterium]